jgi:adenylate cyclase
MCMQSKYLGIYQVCKRILSLLILCLLVSNIHAQTKEEQLRKLRDELKDQNQRIDFLNDQHNDAKNKQLEELNREKVQKERELRQTQEEVNRSKMEAAQSMQQAAVKTREAQLSKDALQQTSKELVHSQEEVQQSMIAMQRQQDSIRLLNQEQSLKDLDLKNQKLVNEQQQQTNKLFLAGIALVSVVLLGMIALYFVNRRKNKELAEKNRVIEQEKQRSEELLLNILPEDVVEELKSQGKTNAKSYQMATVLFADIKDFTSISETLSPEDLVSSLEVYFEAFDRIIEKHNVEKIKTIGDAYVCVGGVPVANENNPEDVINTGIEFQKVVLSLKRERELKGLPCFDVRIGIHAGPLVAGVVGIKKFAYDIWGDTVNMAARMQQYGEPYQVNISEDTYQIVKNKFACIYRGKVEVKGKGMTDMYFVDRLL